MCCASGRCSPSVKRNPRGSELARDSGVSANINAGCAGLIVGTPPGPSSLPQCSRVHTDFVSDTVQLWERACSRKRSVSQHQCWMCRPHRRNAARTKLAPTMFEGTHRFRVRHSSTVGASLLAKAECQPTSMLDVPASSSERRPDQARSHNVRGYTQISCPTQFNCGSELARDSVRSVNIDVECSAVIASTLPQGFVYVVLTLN